MAKQGFVVPAGGGKRFFLSTSADLHSSTISMGSIPGCY